ncbi:hypothetical protein F5Y12DRAFT_139797 [Xylaria sp. FL1777]|nr:hypothetical protein F5Y12DRAFT_139797 [Xylaria sp. FL1777]
MFGGSRRRRPPATPFNSTTANPNATTAAASAFMSAANHNPNKTLSSAAAAAALRARPHTPTNVAEVQTKRTVRRSASLSSSGSARLANGRGQQERRGSTASMTERTFRTPSPHRQSTPTAHERQPPVPRIPDGHKISASGSRITGVAMQTFRTASQKMTSSPPSWHVQPSGDVSNVRTSDSVTRTINSLPPRHPNPVTSQPSRSDSRSSINFSYPTTFRPQSPPASPASPATAFESDVITASRPPSPSAPNLSKGPPSTARTQTGRQLVYDPNSRRMIPKAQVEEATGYEIRQITEKPSKRRKDGALRREGNQPAKGTIARTRRAMVDENKSLRELPKREQPVVEALPTAEERLLDEEPGVRTDEVTGNSDWNSPTQRPEPRESMFRSSPPTHSPPAEQQSDFLPGSYSRLSPVATVQDEPLVDDGKPKTANYSQPPQTVRDVLDSMPTRQVLSEGLHRPHPSQKSDRLEMDQESRPSSTVGEFGLPEIHGEQKVMAAQNKPIVELFAERGDMRRSSSNSPARQARFATGPAEKLAVRHIPLPRSASPIKSAMKQTSPVQGETSPSDNVSDPSRSGAVSPDRKEDRAIPRKKSVRVSFDDHGTTVVRDSTTVIEEYSPATQSPQGGKRAWFSNIARSKKKEIALDDDEVMKPRPALPSFGSIRDKRVRELGERPLVRPLEFACSTAISSSPELRPQSSSTINDSETLEECALDQPSDHTISALLSQDQTNRNTANISRFREPLPPVVTSIEGSGYSSDSIQGSDFEEQTGSTIAVGISGTNSSVPGSQLTQSDMDNSSQTTGSRHEEIPQTASTPQQDIPHISVIQPSPMSEEHSHRADPPATRQDFDVPGGFPEFESDESCDSLLELTKDSASAAIPEPTTVTAKPGQVGLSHQTTVNSSTAAAIFNDTAEDESDESVYSDAYEDIPDVNSCGFLSLDAVVDGPIDEASKPRIPELIESVPVSIVTSEPKHDAILEKILAPEGQPRPPPDTDDWEQAKAFWRSLTAEKRRQLEQEATEEAGAEGDREDASQPIRRNSSRRKSTQSIQPTLRTSLAHGKVQQPEPYIKLSRRDNGATKTVSAQPRTGMRKTLRSNGETQSAAKSSIRQAALVKLPAPKPSLSSRHQATYVGRHSETQPDSSSGVTTQAKPGLQRRRSNGSDSSFKRSRHSPVGTLAFRNTMRQASIQSHHKPISGSGRLSLRSLSPAGSTVWPDSTTRFSTSSPVYMKRTLRSGSESSHEGNRSSVHFPLFLRSIKSHPSRPKYSSRFEDSSDEDGETFADFRSRLDDSSDEEIADPSSSKQAKLPGTTTTRRSATTTDLSKPAPVPELEEDSHEIYDSDDNLMSSPSQSLQSRAVGNNPAGHLGTELHKSGAIGTLTLGQTKSGQRGFTPSMTSPTLTTKDKRGSLLTILRFNKRVDRTGKIQRAELVDSAARRDTKLERDREQLKELRNEQLSSSRLQKRTFINHNDVANSQRPRSVGNMFSHGTTAGTLEQPYLDHRRNFRRGANTANESYEFENASAENPSMLKKKKFGTLRRMFKLDE